MNTRFYETLIILAKTGNFSKTAEQMNATQPTISGRINALEDYFGVQVYERGAKPFKLTPLGKIMLEYAKKIVAVEGRLEENISQKELKGTIRIGAIEIVTMSWLPQFIRKIRDRCPGLSVEITTGTASEMAKCLKNDELDLILSIAYPVEYGIKSNTLYTLKMAWIVNPNYFPVDKVIEVSELSNHMIVMLSPKVSTYPYIKEYFVMNGVEDLFIDTRSVKIDCVVSVPTAFNIVKSGLGIVPAPPAMLVDDLLNNTLARLPVRQELPNIDVVASFKEKNKTPMLDQIMDIARECADEFVKNIPDELAWT